MAAGRQSPQILSPVLLLLLFVVSCTRGDEGNSGPCKSMYNKPCVSDNIRFFLYTSSGEGEEVVVAPAANLTASSFDPLHPTKIIIHGFNSDKDLVYLVDIRKGYLSSGPHNVIAVDWSEFSSGPWFCYPTVADNADPAGRCVAELVMATRSAGAEDVHLVGFSVGAHVAGLTANHLGDYTLPRVTGLDPAMPLFVTRGARGRLDRGDALFVDVVHTNALVQGMAQECGHVDFYMNGGVLQPGCGLDLRGVSACSHHRAPAYFAESISSERGFWGWRCPGMLQYLLGVCPPRRPAAIMGANASSNSRGFHIVMTSATSPYALGKWTP